MKRMINESTWMSVDSKEQSLIKADAMHSNIGYPDWILDDLKLDEYYKEVICFKTSSKLIF
jgi:predicted metalloendopeptidase